MSQHVFLVPHLQRMSQQGADHLAGGALLTRLDLKALRQGCSEL